MIISTISSQQTVVRPSSLGDFSKEMARNSVHILESSQHYAESNTPYRVLVVDSVSTTQKTLAYELEQLSTGMHIDFADNGVDALINAAKTHYDFVLLALNMAVGIDGLEICRQMRQQTNMKKIPIIMLSAQDSPMDEAKSIIAGCTTFLTKPIMDDDFQQVLRRVCKWVDQFNAK